MSRRWETERRLRDEAARMTTADLRRRVIELENQVLRLRMDRDELQTELDRLSKPDPRAAEVERHLADPEYVELCRIAAWAAAPGSFRYWNPETAESAYPEGWPEGTTPEAYIAGLAGLPAPAEPPPAPPRTFMHDMLGRGNSPG